MIEQITPFCYPDLNVYYYRTHQGAECDLDLAKATIPRVSIEIKFTDAPKVPKGLLNSIADLGTKNNYIICLTDEDYPIADNIQVCSVSSFIQHHLNHLTSRVAH